MNTRGAVFRLIYKNREQVRFTDSFPVVPCKNLSADTLPLRVTAAHNFPL